MKAISLWEPWATAIAIGAKKIETRSWATSYRGPLAIHAAKLASHAPGIYAPLLRPVFAAAGITEFRHLAFGCVVATCRVVDVRRTEVLRDGLGEIELLLGNYDDDRYGWVLGEVRRLPVPVPARGAQGFWQWDGGPSQLGDTHGRAINQSPDLFGNGDGAASTAD